MMPVYRPPIAIAPPGGENVWRPPTPRPGAPPIETPPIVGIQIPPSGSNEITPIWIAPIEQNPTPHMVNPSPPIWVPPAPPTANPPRPPIELPTPIWGTPNEPWEFWNSTPPIIRGRRIPIPVPL